MQANEYVEGQSRHLVMHIHSDDFLTFYKYVRVTTIPK